MGALLRSTADSVDRGRRGGGFVPTQKSPELLCYTEWLTHWYDYNAEII